MQKVTTKKKVSFPLEVMGIANPTTFRLLFGSIDESTNPITQPFEISGPMAGGASLKNK